MIVDCHTHWGPGWAQKHGDDPSAWLAVLDRHGVGRAFLLGCDGLMRLDRCRADNDAIARVSARSAGRLIPFGTAWPQMGNEGVAEARRCLEELGMPGLKFHPWLQGFSTADPSFGEICRLAGDRGVPIIFHDGTPCYSLPEQVAGLARRFPQTTFVLGHSGLLWSWRSALAAARLPNVWSCLCGPHLRAIERFCREADAGRLLWGSDFGFGFADPIDYRLGLIRQVPIDESLRRRILSENPVRLLNSTESR